MFSLDVGRFMRPQHCDAQENGLNPDLRQQEHPVDPPVVLVGRLAHHDVVAHLAHSLAEGHHRVRDPDLGATHEVLLQVLQADLQMELASTCSGRGKLSQEAA